MYQKGNQNLKPSCCDIFLFYIINYLSNSYFINNGSYNDVLFFFLQETTLACNVCKETIKKVSHCPTTSELRTLEKCTGVCGDSEGNYEYHCARDSTGTYLVELCAVSLYVFGNVSIW